MSVVLVAGGREHRFRHREVDVGADQVGSLAVGKRADFVLLAQDPLAIAPARLRELTVLATYVDGKPVFEAGKATAAD